MKTLQNMIYILLLIGLAIVFCSFTFQKSLVNTQRVSLEGVSDINVRYIAEQVTFYESENEELILKEYMNKDNQRYFAHISNIDGKVNIEVGNRPWLSFLNVEVEVYLPKNYQGKLNITTVSGKIESKVDFITEELSIYSTSGSIILQSLSVDKILLKSTSGQINTADIKGNADVRTTSGYIDIDAMSGKTENVSSTSGTIDIGTISAYSTNIKNNSGKVNIDKVFGTINVKTISGKIDVNQINNSGNFESTSGKITTNFINITGNISVKTTSGKVYMTVPDNLSFYFNASTTSGAIRTAFNNANNQDYKSVSQQVGSAPKMNIAIKTVSGSIDVIAQPIINEDILKIPKIL